MTLIRKRTMKLVAGALIATLVLLMLPMTAKAATEYIGDDSTKVVQITAAGVITNREAMELDDAILYWTYGWVYDESAGEIIRDPNAKMTADSITVDATAKTITFKNLSITKGEFYVKNSNAVGWKLIFEGANSIPAFEGFENVDGKLTIDMKDGATLNVTNVGYGCFLFDGCADFTIVVADGVSVEPTNFMDQSLQTSTNKVVFSKGGSSEDTPTTDYIINDGSTDPITAQTGKDLVIKCSGPVEHLSNVLMDGNEVAAENMSLESGSTILTLKAAYLATLAAGEHTVSFVYDDGTTVDATFTLTKTPQTGDPMATYVLVVAIAAGVATTVVFAKKKSANE